MLTPGSAWADVEVLRCNVARTRSPCNQVADDVGVDAVGYHDVGLGPHISQRTSESCQISTVPHPSTAHGDSEPDKVVEERAFGDER